MSELTAKRVLKLIEQGISLYKAELSGLDLSGGNLRGADMSFANLQHANLRNANLLCANLEGANLSHAQLEGADLRYANLKNAAVADTVLEQLNLEDVTRLKFTPDRDELDPQAEMDGCGCDDDAEEL